MTPAIFFSLLIIAVAFLPVFTLTGQAGRLFKPLAYTKTFVMLISALLSITFAPALRDLLIRGKIRPEKKHPVSRVHHRGSTSRSSTSRCAGRSRRSRSACSRWPRRSRSALRLGHEFMPPLNEGDLLYMPITFPNISIEEAKRQLQYQDRMLRSFPEVETVFGKVGRAESADRSGAASRWSRPRCSSGRRDEWRKKHHERWYSGWAPGWLKPAFRPLWPEEQPHDLGRADHRDERQDAVPGLDQRLDDADQDARRHADHRRPHADRHQGVRHRSRRDRAASASRSSTCSRRSRGRAACSTSGTSAASTSTSSPSPTSWPATACASPTSSASSRAPSAARRSGRRSRGATASRSTCAIRRTCAATWSRCAAC